MPLLDLDVPIRQTKLPGDVRAFLREADRRITRFLREGHVPAFVPSDFPRVYQTLRALSEAGLTQGGLFCEWGSGFGVVACLATLLDFDAFGIEVEDELVEAAQELADDFGLPVEFVHGSFLPADFDARGQQFAWLTTDTHDGHATLDLGPDDFDVIFAYPWPDEESLTADLFERRGRVGALLVTYHTSDELRVQRKITRSRRGNSRQK
jgi:hypothetical protein